VRHFLLTTLVVLAAVCVAPAAADPPDQNQLEFLKEAMRRELLKTPGISELLERDSDVARRFDNWLTTIAQEQSSLPTSPPPTNTSLREELLSRMKQDQEVRRHSNSGDLVKTDKKNREWLSNTIDECGWPGKSMVGADGAHAAWIIAQHADINIPFQRRCLKLMQAAEPGEVALGDIAYLIDRICVAEGKLQKYGTQFETSGKSMELRAIDVEEDVNQLRERMGMMPLEVYLLFAAAQSGKDASDTSP
jgi:hypothetical protein